MSGRQRQRVAARRVSYGPPDSQHPRAFVAVTGGRPATSVTLAERGEGGEDTSPTGSVEFLRLKSMRIAACIALAGRRREPRALLSPHCFVIHEHSRLRPGVSHPGTLAGDGSPAFRFFLVGITPYGNWLIIIREDDALGPLILPPSR